MDYRSVYRVRAGRRRELCVGVGIYREAVTTIPNGRSELCGTLSKEASFFGQEAGLE